MPLTPDIFAPPEPAADVRPNLIGMSRNEMAAMNHHNSFRALSFHKLYCLLEPVRIPAKIFQALGLLPCRSWVFNSLFFSLSLLNFRFFLNILL